MSAPAPETASTPTTDDPRDRRRYRAALWCVGICALATGLAIGGANRENVGIVAIIALIVAASAAGLWALITLSTKSAVDQLVDRILTAVRALLADVTASLVEDMRGAVRDEIRTKPSPNGRRDLDGDTEDLGGGRYAGAGRTVVMATSPVYGGVMNAAIDQAAARIFERFEEHGRQKWYEGYARREEDDAAGGVTPLQPRNGHRSAR